jgi:hypothetical protein
MPPDPLVGPDGTVDAITAEVAMERAVYAFQIERLYATHCAKHPDSPLPVLVDTLGDDQQKALATLRRAVEPDVQLRQRAAIDGYCDWSRVAHLVASVLASEASSGALPMQVKRRMRDQELLVPREPFGARQGCHGMRLSPLERERRAAVHEHERGRRACSGNL